MVKNASGEWGSVSGFKLSVYTLHYTVNHRNDLSSLNFEDFGLDI